MNDIFVGALAIAAAIGEAVFHTVILLAALKILRDGFRK